MNIKQYTKAKPSEIFDAHNSTQMHDYVISLEILAWEYYDEGCGVNHPNWKLYNQNWDTVAEVFGGVKGDTAELWVMYDNHDIMQNPEVVKAVSEATKMIHKELEHHLKSKHIQ